MALDRLQRGLLLSRARQYINQGYRVGMCQGKAFLGEITAYDLQDRMEAPEDMDGISIIPENIVCVDFDCDFKDLGWRRDLPPTWKERTPRGWHLFYRLQASDNWKSRIGFVPQVDLLVRGSSTMQVQGTAYGGKSSKKGNAQWGGHVIVSPTNGYRRIWPENLPYALELTWAPGWLRDAVL